MRRINTESRQARSQRRADARMIGAERERSELSDFLIVFGEIADSILPFGWGSQVARWIVRRRARRYRRDRS